MKKLRLFILLTFLLSLCSNAISKVDTLYYVIVSSIDQQNKNPQKVIDDAYNKYNRAVIIRIDSLHKTYPRHNDSSKIRIYCAEYKDSLKAVEYINELAFKFKYSKHDNRRPWILPVWVENNQTKLEAIDTILNSSLAKKSPITKTTSNFQPTQTFAYKYIIGIVVLLTIILLIIIVYYRNNKFEVINIIFKRPDGILFLQNENGNYTYIEISQLQKIIKTRNSFIKKQSFNLSKKKSKLIDWSKMIIPVNLFDENTLMRIATNCYAKLDSSTKKAAFFKLSEKTSFLTQAEINEFTWIDKVDFFYEAVVVINERNDNICLLQRGNKKYAFVDIDIISKNSVSKTLIYNNQKHIKLLRTICDSLDWETEVFKINVINNQTIKRLDNNYYAEINSSEKLSHLFSTVNSSVFLSLDEVREFKWVSEEDYFYETFKIIAKRSDDIEIIQRIDGLYAFIDTFDENIIRFDKTILKLLKEKCNQLDWQSDIINITYLGQNTIKRLDNSLYTEFSSTDKIASLFYSLNTNVILSDDEAANYTWLTYKEYEERKKEEVTIIYAWIEDEKPKAIIQRKNGLFAKVVRPSNSTNFIKDSVLKIPRDKCDTFNWISENEYKIILEKVKKEIEYPITAVDNRELFIDYDPNLLSDFCDLYKNPYPYISVPQKAKAAIKLPREGKMGLKGYKEAEFEEYLRKYFEYDHLEVHTNHFVVISDKVKPYEPDFTIINTDINLYIDIEIDEPYGAISRQATHFIGQDDDRNQFFNDRGWVVIRFSEKQVHEYPKQCCAFIAKVISKLDNTDYLPSGFELVSLDTQWSKEQSEQWALEKYREKYLGVHFEPKEVYDIDTSNLRQNELEKKVEENIKPNSNINENIIIEANQSSNPTFRKSDPITVKISNNINESISTKSNSNLAYELSITSEQLNNNKEKLVFKKEKKSQDRNPINIKERILNWFKIIGVLALLIVFCIFFLKQMLILFIVLCFCLSIIFILYRIFSDSFDRHYNDFPISRFFFFVGMGLCFLYVYLGY